MSSEAKVRSAARQMALNPSLFCHGATFRNWPDAEFFWETNSWTERGCRFDGSPTAAETNAGVASIGAPKTARRLVRVQQNMPTLDQRDGGGSAGPGPVDQRLLDNLSNALFRDTWHGRMIDWTRIRQRLDHLSDDEYRALLRQGIAQSRARVQRDSRPNHDHAPVCLVC